MKNEKRQGKKLFLPICVTRSNTLRNYFQGLKIYFQGLVIYFQGLIIYFQALKIIFRHALRQKYLSRAELANMVRGRFIRGRQPSALRQARRLYANAYILKYRLFCSGVQIVAFRSTDSCVLVDL